LNVSVLEHMEKRIGLAALRAFRKGDFSVRLPIGLTGIDGEIGEAFNDVVELNERLTKEFERRKKRVIELMNAIPGLTFPEPDGAFYVFPTVSSFFGKNDGEETLPGADDLCMYLLNKAHVSTVTGRAFGEPQAIRISFANSMEKIEEAWKRITAALAKLK